jgi:hypothetical protein
MVLEELPGIELIRMFAVMRDDKLRFNSAQAHRFLKMNYPIYKNSDECMFMDQIDRPEPNLAELFRYRYKLIRKFAEPLSVTAR